MRLSAFVPGARLASVILVATAACGCSRGEPEDADNGGHNGRAVAPVGGARLNPALAGGQAEWVEFREPKLAEPPGAEKEEPVGNTAGAEGRESEFRKLVQDYNDIGADGDVEDFLEYFVADQVEAMRPVLQSALAVAAKLTQLCTGMKEKREESDRVAEVCQRADKLFGVELGTESLTMAGKEGAVIKMASRVYPADVQVVVVEGDLYFKIGDLTGLSVSQVSLDAFSSQLDGWLLSLQDGSKPVSEILQALDLAASGEVESKDGGAASGG